MSALFAAGSRFWRSRGFTLIELLVSVAILALLLLIIASIIDATRRTWGYASGRIEEFRGAREAFESITSKLSQATLNPYWDYNDPNNPTSYSRQSELRFRSGPASAMLSDPAARTHGVFFTAPLGYVNNTNYADLGTLMNTCGFFLEFGSDKDWRPDFVNQGGNAPRERYRSRLMEVVGPAESFSLYDEAQKAGGNAGYDGRSWFKSAVDGTAPYTPSTRPVRVLAENIVALILLPKLSSQEDPTGIKLAPTYEYDSTDSKTDPVINPKNQLPPVVQVTMVAVDETSFIRLQNGDSPPNMAPIYAGCEFTDASRYERDLQTLESNLKSLNLSYRIFTMNVALKAAKWSREQSN